MHRPLLGNRNTLLTLDFSDELSDMRGLISQSSSTKVGVMRFLPTKIHAGLDYILGVALAISPFFSGIHQGDLIEWGPMLLGHSLIVYSLLTNYELGLIRLIPIKQHLLLDAAGGVVL
jgi:hypothetical protein